MFYLMLLQPLCSSDGNQFRLLLKVIQKCFKSDLEEGRRDLWPGCLFIHITNVLNCHHINVEGCFSSRLSFSPWSCPLPPQGAILTTMLVSRNFSGECSSLKRVEGTQRGGGGQDDMPSVFCHLFTHTYTHTHTHSRFMGGSVRGSRKRSRDICLEFCAIILHGITLFVGFLIQFDAGEPLCSVASDQSGSTEAIKHFSVSNSSYYLMSHVQSFSIRRLTCCVEFTATGEEYILAFSISLQNPPCVITGCKLLLWNPIAWPGCYL